MGSTGIFMTGKSHILHRSFVVLVVFSSVAHSLV